MGMASLCGTRRVEPGDRSQAVDVGSSSATPPEMRMRQGLSPPDTHAGGVMSACLLPGRPHAR